MNPLPEAPPPPLAAGAPYDSRRGVYYVKPVLRGWLHLLWFETGAAAGVLMLKGGLLYTAGALSYHRRWPDPYPAVFGSTRSFMPASAPPRRASTPR